MKLSIITINLNNRYGLEKTIESVINQVNFPDYEYIIIDGGSNDGSVDLIQSYGDKISYWISEPDKGIYHAMNKGVQAAKGEYCLFMNSADTLFSKTVLYDVFSLGHSSDVIYGNLMCGGKVSIAEEVITFKNLLTHTLGHQSSFIKRTLLMKNPYDEELKIVSDWKFFFQELILNNVSAQKVNLIIADFDVTGISMVSQSELRKERHLVLKEIFPPKVLDEIFKYFGLNDEYYSLMINLGDSTHKWKFYNTIVCGLKLCLFFKRWVWGLTFH